MSTKSLWYPGEGAPENMTFRDSAYGALAGTMWSRAPSLAQLCCPGEYYQFHEDFSGWNATAAEQWTQTTVGTGTYLIDVLEKYGALKLTTTAGATDANQMQLLAGVVVAAGKPVFAEAMVKIDTNALTAFLWGLAVTDTSLLASAPTDGIYFRKDSADANIDCVSRASSTSTDQDTTIDAVNAAYVRLGIVAFSTQVDFYVDGVLKKSSTTNIPTAILRPSFAVLNGEAAAKNYHLDFVKVLAAR